MTLHCPEARRLSSTTADLHLSQTRSAPHGVRITESENSWIGISWRPRLKSSRNRIPDLRGDHPLDRLESPKIPAQKSAPHK